MKKTTKTSKTSKATKARVTPFQATLSHVESASGVKGKKAYAIARTLLLTGDLTPSGRYNRLARVAKSVGLKNPFAIARAVLPSWQVEYLNASK